MGAVLHRIGDGSSAIGLDPNPNTTDPDASRKFDTPFPTAPCGAASLYAVTKGGTSASIKIWMYDESMDHWFGLGSAVTASVDKLTPIVDVPRGARLTVQVTLNVGVTQIGIGLMGDG